MGYEIIDHTGDIGIEVRERTLEELFITASRALFELMVEKPGKGSEKLQVSVEGEDPADILRTLLGEFLFNFTVHGTIAVVDAVSIETGRVTARGRSRKFDPDNDMLNTELKAVTYHQLEVKQEGDGWVARLIFDV